MTVITKPIGRLPLNKGDWDANYVNPKTGINGYGKKFRVIRYGCELESKMENNTYDPIAWDGMDSFVIDTTHWLFVSGNPMEWLAGQNKPATTGTTGNYPYNGMGRVVLKKHIVEVGGVEKNLLYQDDFKKGPEGARVDNENTVFVIQYDFELAEDITIPANCVLEFDGGSIKNGTIRNVDRTIFINPVFDSVSFSPSYQNVDEVLYPIKYPIVIGSSKFTNCEAPRVFVTNDTRELTLDVRDLPGPLSKYNLSMGDNVDDNAEKLNGLFQDGNFLVICNTIPVSLLFGCTHEPATRQKNVYMFKDIISITATKQNIHLKIMANIKFDLSKYSYRSIQDIENGVAKLGGNDGLIAIRMSSVENVIIEGIINRQTLELPIIDFGEDTIQGDYFSDITIGNKYYDTTDQYRGIIVENLENVHIKNIEFRNFFDGVTLVGRFANVENCIFRNGIRDNGLTITYPHPSLQSGVDGMSYVKNCCAYNIAGVGFSAQGSNILFENCLAKNCGNDAINSETYGTHDTRVAGGGYSIENLNKFSYGKSINVSFVNCKAEDCYNNGFVTDCGGIKFINCEVKNITNTVLNQDYPSGDGQYEHKYNTLPIRCGSAFAIESNYLLDGSHGWQILNPIIIIGCIIENVKFLATTLNVLFDYGASHNRQVPAIISGCYIAGVSHNLPYIETNYAKENFIINDSAVVNINDNYVKDYVKYINCHDRLGNNFIPVSGNVSSRPSGKLITVGFEYFDTSLSPARPIYASAIANDGTVTWVDATGTTI